MTIKEMKEQIEDLNDDALVLIRDKYNNRIPKHIDGFDKMYFSPKETVEQSNENLAAILLYESIKEKNND